MATNVTASTAQIFDGIIQYPGTNTFKMSPVAVAAATTLTIAQSGSMINVTPGAGYTITLPVAATATGCNYRFQMVAAGNTANLIIKPAAANNLVGVCMSPTGNITSGGNTQLNVVQGTSVAGDYAIVACDGISWSVLAVSRINVGVTLT